MHLLAQGTDPKTFSLFSAEHTIPSEAKGSPFQFFSGIVRLFFETKIFPKCPPSIILEFCDRMDPQRVPFQFFGIVSFFQENIFTKGALFNFLMICARMDEKSQGVPPCALIRWNVWVFRVV